VQAGSTPTHWVALVSLGNTADTSEAVTVGVLCGDGEQFVFHVTVTH
jgi:hypothetical protein